jgi:hypothetical protein
MRKGKEKERREARGPEAEGGKEGTTLPLCLVNGCGCMCAREEQHNEQMGVFG